LNRFKLKKLRSVTAVVYSYGCFDIPMGFSYRRLFDKIPKFEIAIDLRGRLHLVSVEPVKNANNYFEPIEGKRGEVNEE